MNEERHLDARGKGELSYDYVHDVLIFKIKDRDYKMSVEFQNFAIDLDSEDFVTGIRIFDVSEVSGLKRIVFKNLIHGEFKASIKDKIISVRLNIVGKLRNKIIPIFSKEQNYTQQISAPVSAKYPIEDSEVTAPEVLVS